VKRPKPSDKWTAKKKIRKIIDTILSSACFAPFSACRFSAFVGISLDIF